MALRLTSATDYAIRSMLYIASLPEDRVVLRTEVAEAQKIPPSFTAKILRALVRAGLLRSSRGVHGGFALARPAAEVNLLEVIEAIEGPLGIAECVPDPLKCEHAVNCPASAVWTLVQERIADILRGITLEALVSAPRRHGKVDFRLEELQRHAAEA